MARSNASSESENYSLSTVGSKKSKQSGIESEKDLLDLLRMAKHGLKRAYPSMQEGKSIYASTVDNILLDVTSILDGQESGVFKLREPLIHTVEKYVCDKSTPAHSSTLNWADEMDESWDLKRITEAMSNHNKLYDERLQKLEQEISSIKTTVEQGFAFIKDLMAQVPGKIDSYASKVLEYKERRQIKGPAAAKEPTPTPKEEYTDDKVIVELSVQDERERPSMKELSDLRTDANKRLKASTHKDISIRAFCGTKGGRFAVLPNRGVSAKGLIGSREVWTSVFDQDIASAEISRQWGWVLVHGIPLDMFGDNSGMSRLRQEIQEFGGVNLMADPTWISSFQRRQDPMCKFSSVKIAVETEEEARQLSKPNVYLLVCGLRLQTTGLVRTDPSTRCDRCLKYGHALVNCRGKFTCIKCGDEHCVSECLAENFKCSNCRAGHKATDKSCEAYINAKKLAAEKRSGNQGASDHDAQ